MKALRLALLLIGVVCALLSIVITWLQWGSLAAAVSLLCLFLSTFFVVVELRTGACLSCLSRKYTLAPIVGILFVLLLIGIFWTCTDSTPPYVVTVVCKAIVAVKGEIASGKTAMSDIEDIPITRTWAGACNDYLASH